MALNTFPTVHGSVSRAFVKDGAGVAILGVLTGQMAIGLGLVVVPKLYSPTAFGVATAVFNAAAVLSVVASFRLEVLLPSADEHDVRVISRKALGLATALAVPLGAISCAAAGAWSLRGWVTSCCLVLSIAAVGVAGYRNSRMQQFRRTGAGKLAQGCTQTAVLVGGGVAGGTATWAAVSFLSGYVVSATTQLAGGGLSHEAAQKRAALRVDWWKQALLVLSALCNSTFVLGLVPLLAFFWGTAAAGRVAIAQRLVSIPVALVVVALQPILLGRLSAQWRVGGLDAAILRRTMAKFAVVAVVYIGVMIPLSSWVLRASGSAAWSGATAYVLPLCLLAAAQIAVNPLAMLPAALGNWRGQVAWDVARVLLLLGGIAVLRYARQPSATAVWMATIVGVLFYAVQVPLIFSAARTGQPDHPSRRARIARVSGKLECRNVDERHDEERWKEDTVSGEAQRSTADGQQRHPDCRS